MSGDAGGTTPPLPRRGARWALFLDFDGTLTEIASHPDGVRVAAGVHELLARLERGLGGALALVSGRQLDSLDRHLHPARPPAAGMHGLERRNVHGPQSDDASGELAAAGRALAAWVAGHPGLVLEDKGEALTLHYRNAPELEKACRERVEALVSELPRHHVMGGKMVLEIKPRHVDKGTAIGAFMDEPPFRGRVPVFAGDDRTDEDGFAWVNARDGISIKVGDGETCARYRLDGVPALHDWLARLARTIDAGDAA